MDESMTHLIQRLKQSELQADVQRNELMCVKKKIEDFHIEMRVIKEKSKNLKKVQDVNVVNFITLGFDANQLDKTEKFLVAETLTEKKRVQETEKIVLEDLRNDIWQKRKAFADKAREFNDKHGLLVPKSNVEYMPPTAIKLNSRLATPTPVDQEEFVLLTAEVASMEDQLSQLHREQAERNLRQVEVEKALERLTNDENFANDLVRGKQSLVCIQQQIETIETQCLKVQKQLNHQELLIKAGQPPAKPRAPYVYSQKPTVPSQSSGHKYEKCAPYSSTYSNTSMARETVEVGGRADEVGDRRAFVTAHEWHRGGLATPSVKCAPAQGEKGDSTTGRKTFVPKTPSLMTQKLLSSKKSTMELEQTFLNITRQRSAPIPSKEIFPNNAAASKEALSGEKSHVIRKEIRGSVEDANTRGTARMATPYIT